MREIPQPVTVRVFEGEMCRVTVKKTITDSVRVFVVPSFDMEPGILPEHFATVASDLAEMAGSVQKAAREMLRESVKAMPPLGDPPTVTEKKSA